MVKKNKNPEKSWRKKIPRKKAILLVFQYKEDAIRPELSSPACFQNTKI